VARGTQHRKRRATQNARGGAVAATAPRKQKTPQWQEELFFQRLRVHAKWAFVLLAVVFALSFVVFGVGSGSTGISSALQNAFNFGSSGGTSISSLEKKVEKNSQNKDAWRALATAYETKHDTALAIAALIAYTKLAPKDQDALLDLAGQYQQLAQQYSTDYQSAQQEAVSGQLPSSVFAPASNTALGRAFADPGALKDPIGSAVQTQATEKENTALQNYQSATTNALGAYKKIAALNPNDPSTQILLAQSAQTANDLPTAIAAYKRFLKLAPNDPSTSQVKAQLKSLEASQASSSGSTKKSTSG
jgi:cytochrome c-type biogenesis protein CcmH/NrfG